MHDADPCGGASLGVEKCSFPDCDCVWNNNIFLALGMRVRHILQKEVHGSSISDAPSGGAPYPHISFKGKTQSINAHLKCTHTLIWRPGPF